MSELQKININLDFKKSHFELICRFCLRTISHPIPIFGEFIDEALKKENDRFFIHVPDLISLFTNITVSFNNTHLTMYYGINYYLV